MLPLITMIPTIPIKINLDFLLKSEDNSFIFPHQNDIQKLFLD